MNKKFINKLIAGALICGCILPMSNITAKAEISNGSKTTINNVNLKKNVWHGEDGKLYYYDENGVMQKNTIKTINGIKYKFDETGNNVGEMKTDKDDIDKYMHQYSEEYKENDTRWNKKDGEWHFCYLEGDEKYSEGKCEKDDWAEINGYWYHFNKDGEMDKNTTIKDDKGNECKLNADGALINRKEPEFAIEDDTEFKTIDGKDYYIDETGNKKTGWILKGGKWYYADQNGVIQKNKTVIINNKKYTLGSDGVWIN
ncbi:MAG: hypothetical protein E7208_10885 [Clostridium butyricum]|nr:hypothetical protein [Clostridium butyricum]